MTLSRISAAAFALLLVACGASKQGAPSEAPAAGSRPEASSPAEAPPPPPTTPAVPGGVGASPSADEGKGGAAPRAATSPTGDTGPADASATNPAATKRLEDIKTDKATGSSGSYSVSVKSAAGMVADDVGKAANGAAAKTDACYAKAVKKKPAAGSATTFEVSVDAKGGGTAKLLTDGLKDTEWSKCLQDALKGVSWPKPSEKTGKTTIEFAVK